MKWRYYYYRHLAIVLLICAQAAGARAEDELLGSIQLRGGYDSNPTFVPGAKGTALGGVNAAVVAGRTTESYIAALSGEASYTRFDEGLDSPVQRYKAAFDIANKDQSEYSLKSTISAASFENYDTKSIDAIERVRMQKTNGLVRPFVTVEARYSELNESNLLLGDFLPEPEKFLRGTIIPGVALKKNRLEIGTSVNLSVTRYAEKLDLFGFRRDNERMEPFVFLRYNKDKFSLFASVSRLYGDWHDVDFSDVCKNLYEIALSYEADPFGFEFSAKRTAEETTFPVSPITIDTLVSGKVARKLDAKNTIAFFGRYLKKEYLDSPFKQRTRTYGAKLTHEVSDKVSLGFEVARSEMSPILGPDVDGIVAVASLTQRFGDKKRAEGKDSAR
jgi:hypothetical protein